MDGVYAVKLQEQLWLGPFLLAEIFKYVFTSQLPENNHFTDADFAVSVYLPLRVNVAW